MDPKYKTNIWIVHCWFDEYKEFADLKLKTVRSYMSVALKQTTMKLRLMIFKGQRDASQMS
jgi:hypothetical protein